MHGRSACRFRFNECFRGAPVKSEFYHLRRTTIKDLSALCGFLVGFLGSAPFAWRFLGGQLEGRDFVRGLWLFFGIVVAAAIITGAIGLGAGILLGRSWEWLHRRRRETGQTEVYAALPGPGSDQLSSGPAEAPMRMSPDSPAPRLPPKLRLVTPQSEDSAGVEAAGRRPVGDARSNPGQAHRDRPKPLD